MDESEQNIKMCGKAEEIQHHMLDCGDWAKLPAPDNRVVVVIQHEDIFSMTRQKQNNHFVEVAFPKCPTMNRDYKKRKGLIWLPTQDQLQEMVDIRVPFVEPLIDIAMFRKEYTYWLTSMEQLWLAFVMKEKYGKVWDGENWIKQ